ncbi:uncharacterized protein Z518_04601 [Rhinocladiella mackenziei CBS 650.93]|uniref:SnoaL-like domain-containing protein n=1 Tax=Rhinocladiella mackenziei CBS 650.93 TaxID=1442369 RepID=A0A0D2JC02_9EURO|nr:uncharacterized protein Z518_04601 [Rhinocladiella mackenziei CBS 650.93]KIX06625.1 hypothetical protein Z518_04601 [Rhinocladiella mackenziei CBS 650.93]
MASKTTMKAATINLGYGISSREAAIDAVYRFTQGLDNSDEALIRSAFTTDAVIDRSGLKSVIGFEFPGLEGLESIVSDVLSTIGPMDTGHHVSNARVEMSENEEEAQVTCYVLAQHYRPGEGCDPAKKIHLLIGNHYKANVVRDQKDELWKIKRMEFSSLWSDGDLSVLGM